MNDDEIITGNQTEEADLLKVLLALKANVMRDLQVADLGRVTKIENDNYFVTLLNNSEQKIVCKTFHANPNVGDIVYVSFINNDYKDNLYKAQNNIPTQNISTKEYHSFNSGLILGIGEAPVIDPVEIHIKRWS